MTPDRWKRVQEVFAAATEREPGSRAALLDEACRDDPELRTEVESLLSSLGAASSGFLESPAIDAVPALSPTNRKAGSPSLVRGARLGPYEVLGPLGTGGMGEVYRAKDPRLDREVAIKVLPERLASDPAALSRFEREAKVLAALSHPNVLGILDFGQQDGVAYAVTELLEGETLRTRLTRSAPSWREGVELAVAIADGLAAAHSKGIIHRDLKPENVFLTSDGRVKILDFGLARREKPFSPVSQQTEAGTVMGTVGYMSPEQVDGQSGDARSDIFSFGCVLYEIATGHRAFHGANAQETLAAILRDAPADPLQSGREMPGDLARVILHCLEKRPELRVQSALDLASDLKAILAGSAVSVPAPAVPPAVSRAPRSRALWAIAAGIVLTALAVGLTLAIRSRRPAVPAEPGVIRSLAVLPLENLSHDPEQEYFADGMTDELIIDLAKIGGLRVISRTSVMQYRGTKKLLPQIAKELNVDALVEGSVQRAGNRVTIKASLIQAADDKHLWGDKYERDLKDVLGVQSEAALAIAREIQVKLTPHEQERLAAGRPVNPEAYDAYLKGRYYWYKLTAEDCARSLDFYQRAIEKDPSYAPTHAGISETYGTMVWNGWLSPKEGFPQQEAAALKARELDDTLGSVHFALAYVRFGIDWNWPEAGKEFQRAFALSPQHAAFHRFYSDFLKSQGRWEEAIAQAKWAQELDPLSVETNLSLGSKYYWAGRYDEAIEQYKKTLELDPKYPPVHDYLADVYARKRMHQEAIAEEQKYLSLSGDEEGAAALGRDFGAFGYDKALKNQYQKNLDLLKEASKEAYVSPMFYVFTYAHLGEKEQALSWLEKAYDEHQPWLAYLKTDPQFEPLRTDPRFADLVRRVGIPS
jgi:TolB-like protein/Tfp pilus assembly protein PilF